jgi:hypothetical protein
MPGLLPDGTAFAGTGASEPEQRAARRRLEVDPFPLVSRDHLLASLRQLTAIGSSSLFRNSASSGEATAREYVAGRLSELTFLNALGLEIERQGFRTYLATEAWEARLHLTVGGRELEVPAHALQGSRENLALALRFDSDGVLNDADRNPVVVQGPPVLLRSPGEIAAVPALGLRGRIALLDYAVIDRSIMSSEQALGNATSLLAREPAGLVLVTSFSNRRGESHGTFVGDLSVLVSLSSGPAPPTLYARLEDLAGAGINGWDDFSRVEGVRLVWDADIFSPGILRQRDRNGPRGGSQQGGDPGSAPGLAELARRARQRQRNRGPAGGGAGPGRGPPAAARGSRALLVRQPRARALRLLELPLHPPGARRSHDRDAAGGLPEPAPGRHQREPLPGGVAVRAFR